MFCGKHLIRTLPVFVSILLSANFILAGDDDSAAAEKMLKLQLASIVAGDYERFIEHGNKAFKEFYDQWSFDTLKMSRSAKLSKGYKLAYLGVIRRVGMHEHLWKVSITGDKYELLASLSLANGKVVGFNLD
ncbi:MAG: hypothetical protein JSW26_24495 [Desulfobacterales bacterium]|nr:MAG: hypothetical protein JSW26_24495 [Desulfobacterales bacterium]